MTHEGLRVHPVAGEFDIVISNLPMAQLIVRDLEEEVKLRLQRRARRHGRSTEAEVREILRAAVASERRMPQPLGSRFAARFAGIGLNRPLPELRGQTAEPAFF